MATAPALVACVAMPARAQGRPAPVNAATIVQQGNGHGAPACIACHGPQLLGNAAGGFPRIAGQNADYIQAQLAALANGTRKNAVMLPVASSLSAAERQALAAYISALPVPAALPTSVDSGVSAASAAALSHGERLATRGDWPRGLPGCDQCHGPGGIGVGAAFPPLAGQPALYITNQLAAWQQKTRAGGPLDLMAAIANRMTPADVAAAAAYYAAQPPRPAPHAARATPAGSRP
ncbi:MAG: c-type cytochrome [Gemmatimonadota bacterium]|nr:c-type cytochrome [Gemmatimonadota bacterium]